MSKCAYCRVSTQQEQQENSFEAQQRYYKGIGIDNIYADKGLSGTTIDRENFIKMLNDCGLDVEDYKGKLVVTKARKSKFKYIYCKSISRFSRDIQGAIEVIRALKSNNVYCIFEQENINTKDSSSDLLMNIMLSMAQQESINTSERVKWGNKRSMENGTFRAHNLYGYDYDKATKEVTINEEQANIVRFIYNSRLKNKGSRVIAKELNSKNIKTKSGADFSANTINSILQNKTYCGYVRRNVCQSNGFGDDKTRVNLPKSEHIYIKSDKVPPIISEELFDSVQELIVSSRDNYKNVGKNKGINELNGKIKCLSCKKNYIKVGNYYTCITKHKQGKAMCDSKNIKVSDIEEMINYKANNLKKEFNNQSKEYISKLNSFIKEIEKFRNNDNNSIIEANKIKISNYKDNINMLLDMALDGASADIIKIKIEDLNNKIALLEEENERLLQGDNAIDNYIAKCNACIDDIKNYIVNLPNKVDRLTYIKDYLLEISKPELEWIELNLYKSNELIIIDNLEKIVLNVLSLEFELKKWNNPTSQ